jgi:hypothetical protein
MNADRINENFLFARFAVGMTMISASLASTLPFITHPSLLLLLYCSCVGFAGAGPGIITSALMDLFPTHLR